MYVAPENRHIPEISYSARPPLGSPNCLSIFYYNTGLRCLPISGWAWKAGVGPPAWAEGRLSLSSGKALLGLIFWVLGPVLVNAEEMLKWKPHLAIDG